MRLINAHSLQLEEVWDENEKQYAILSHRWEDGDVGFFQMQDLVAASEWKGFTKIRKVCKQALRDGYSHVWVDTCCINKASSAELSEAINSMYRWYQASAICYAFLSDVDVDTQYPKVLQEQIDRSKWFTRGWTLQELLAPKQVVFFNRHWAALGSKQSLSRVLTDRTRIDEGILNGEPLSTRSIAQRMSWASSRETTRLEDLAYYLLGIFDVNMPMLYGEGKRAFIRLQEEIIKQSDDHTLFAWKIQHYEQCGLFADSPRAFKDCGKMKSMLSPKGRSPYSMTNRGLSIKLWMTPFKTDTYLACLECVDESLLEDTASSDQYRLGMFLRRLAENDQYAKVEHERNTFLQLRASHWDYERLVSPDAFLTTRPVKEVTVNVRQRLTSHAIDNFSTLLNPFKDCVNGFRLVTPELIKEPNVDDDSNPDRNRFKICEPSWNAEGHIMFMKPGSCGNVGFCLQDQNASMRAFKLGFDFDYNPICFVVTSDGRINVYNKVKRLPEHRSDGRISRIGLQDDLAYSIQWTEETKVQYPSTYRDKPFDTPAWSRVHNGVAWELENEPGLWVLKGDRISGLHVELMGSKKIATLHIARAGFQNKIVWDVSIEDLHYNEKKGVFRRMFT